MDAKIVRQAEKGLKPFPQRLSGLLQEKGITQEELARELGKSRQAVSLYCNKTEPDFETLVKIAVYLGSTVDYLVGMPGEDLPTHEAASVAEQTGLSPLAVQRLVESIDNPLVALFYSDLITSRDSSMLPAYYGKLKEQLTRAREEAQREYPDGYPPADFDTKDCMARVAGVEYIVSRIFGYFLDNVRTRGLEYYPAKKGESHGKGEE